MKHVVPTADDPRLREEALADNERLAAVLRLMRRTGIAYAFDTERRMVSVMLAVGEFPRGVPQSVAPDRAMRVSAGPQKDVSAYQFETVLPIRLGSPGIPASGTTMRDRLAPMIADNAKDIIIDDRTGTISIVSVWPIDGNETLERVVEQGVAQASTLGQRALIALALS